MFSVLQRYIGAMDPPSLKAELISTIGPPAIGASGEAAASSAPTSGVMARSGPASATGMPPASGVRGAASSLTVVPPPPPWPPLPATAPPSPLPPSPPEPPVPDLPADEQAASATNIDIVWNGTR